MKNSSRQVKNLRFGGHNDIRKPVLVRKPVHRALKRIAFNHSLKLQDLVDAIIQTVLDDQTMLKEAIQKIKPKNF